MFHPPAVDINLDPDSADPLNPTINYTHFHPSEEQRDPHIPLGFKIYGIGCLVLFIVLLLLATAYVIRRQISCLRKNRCKDEKGKTLPRDLLDTGIVCSSVPLEDHPAKYHATTFPRLVSSTAGFFVHRRTKSRDLASWTLANSTPNNRPPYVPPDTHLPRIDFPVATFGAPLASPVSPKTKRDPILPTEPCRAMTISQARLKTSPRTSSRELGNPFLIEQNESLSLTDSLPFVGQGRDSGSPPKGILKTSPTYVARGSPTSRLSPSNALASERPSTLSMTTCPDLVNRSSDTLSSTLDRAFWNPFVKPSRPASLSKSAAEKLLLPNYGTQNAVKETGRIGEASTAGEYTIVTPPPAATPFRIELGELSPEMSPASSQQTQIVHLGPEPVQVSRGLESLPVRRVSISIPSKNSVGSASRAKGLAISSGSLFSSAREVNCVTSEILRPY